MNKDNLREKIGDYMKKILIWTSLFIVLAGCTQDDQGASLNAKSADGVQFGIKTKSPLELVVESDDNEQEQEKEKESEQNGSEADVITVDNPHETDVIVNKQRRLPEGFEPKDLVEPNVSFNAPEGNPKRLMKKEAAQALEDLFEGAKNAGFDLYAQSGYRSIETQTWIYNNNVETKGQEHADKYSAVPGHSEHHTGLAMDITIPLETGGFLGLEEALGETDAGQWVAEHAHEYGFVIRYPEGKSHITGYEYEPWHLRYFGIELATEIHESRLTVEEFFDLY